MMILGPLACSTTSAVMLAFASAPVSVVTDSPSTRSTAGSVTASPGPAASRLTVRVSPTSTLCWWPPARTIAYTVKLLGLVRGTGQGYGPGPGTVKHRVAPPRAGREVGGWSGARRGARRPGPAARRGQD